MRNALLLVASLFFYLWGEKLYLFVLLSSIGVNYALGLLLERFGAQRGAARALIVLAVLANLGLLIAYKYSHFLIDNLNRVLEPLHLQPLANAEVHLPLGISFFTFHALSYVIDVYRREVAARATRSTSPCTSRFFRSRWRGRSFATTTWQRS